MRAETTARASHPFAKKFFALVATGRGILPSRSKRVASTYATMAAVAGIQPKTLQHIMGHAKSQLTMDMYVKQDSEGMQIASGQLENFLERGVPNVPAFVPKPEVA